MATLRELKKELQDKPRTRTSNTFIHRDIFNSKATKEEINLNNPTDQDQVGRSRYKTPTRIRENDTTRSNVLSEPKESRPSKSTGKRTFEHKPTIQPGSPDRKVTPSKHKIPDHKGEWFYSVSETNKSKGLNAAPIKEQPQQTTEGDISPHRQRKQEELFKTEIAQKNHLEPNGSKLNLVPRAVKDLQTPNDPLQRSISLEKHPKEKRLLHNESNVFNNEEYESKVQSMKPLPSGGEDSTKSDLSLVKTNAFSPEEVEKIKRLNHNFSDVFGLEYGCREGVQVRKQQGRNLSPTLEWTNVDSIKNRKDIGSKNTERQPNYNRSRVYEQKSVMDTHQEYEKPLPKTTKLQTKNPTIKRSTKK